MKQIIRAVHENKGQEVKSAITTILAEKIRESLEIEKLKIGLTYLHPAI